MLRLMIRTALAVLCVCLGACAVDAGAADASGDRSDMAGDGDGDLRGFGNAGALSDVPAGSRKLTVEGKRRLTLEFGQEVQLQVALRDADTGEPVRNAHVSYSIHGRTDSTLAMLATPTDADGLANNTLIAGELTSTFTVEAAAPGATSVTIAVAVSDAGFGTLVIEAPYRGDRLVTRRRVAVVEQVACEKAEPGEGDHMVLLQGEDELGEEFLLPAGRYYTVAAMAEGEDGTVLARACIPRLSLAADQVTVAVVGFEDLPLVANGTYDMLAQLSAEEPSTTLAARFAEGALTSVQTTADGETDDMHAPGRLLLDALGNKLRGEAAADAMYGMLADTLTAERAMPAMLPGPDEALTALLADAEVDPAGAFETLSVQVGQSVAEATLSMEIMVGAGMLWLPRSVSSAPLDDDDTRAQVDLSKQPPAEVTPERAEFGDGFTVEGVRFELPWGTLAARAAHKLAADGQGGHDPALRTAFGCDVFEDYVAELSLLDGACDAACAAAACDAAINTVMEGATAALIDLDTARPAVEIGAMLQLYDDTGDLGANRMDASHLDGVWEAQDGAEPARFSGSAQGEVLISERSLD